MLVSRLLEMVIVFFRVIFYFFINMENYYYEVCSVVCKYLLENKNDFVFFLRLNDVLIESYVFLMR